MSKKVVARLMAALMVVVVMLSVFAGCGGSKEKSTETGKSESSAETSTVEAKKDPVELTVMHYSIENAAASEDAPVYKLLKDKLNIKLKVIHAPWNNYNDKLNVVLASGEIPNIWFGDGVGNVPKFRSWMKQEILLPLSDFSSKYSNLDAALKRFDSFKAAQDGKHYCLPIVSNPKATSAANNDHVLWIRKDWLTKFGLTEPTTLDEFYNVAKAFAQQDPDGNGKQDTYGYTCSEGGVWWSYPIFNAFNTSTERYEKQDGKWLPEVIQPETKEAIAFFKKLYQEKLMDTEFAINSGDKKVEKFISGKAGMMVYNGGGRYNDIYDKFKQAYPDKDPKSFITYVSGLKDKNGNKRLDGFPNFWNCTQVYAGSTEDQKVKSLELLDYLLTDEAMNLCRWGIEGVHYKKDGDKFVNLIQEKDENGNQKVIGQVDPTAKLTYFVSWGGDFIPDNTNNRDEVIKCGSEGNEISNVDPLFGLYIDESALPGEVIKTANDYANTQLLKLIVSKGDLEKEWESFVKTWLEKGGQKVWDETNKKAVEEGR